MKIKIIFASARTLAWVIGTVFFAAGGSVAQESAPPKQKAELFVQTGHSGFIQTLAFAPDGRTLVSGDDIGGSKLWDVATGAELRTFSARGGAVYTAAFAPDGKTFVSGGGDNNVKLWNVVSGKKIWTFAGHTEKIRSVAFSPNGVLIASASDDLTIKLWNAATGKIVRTLNGHLTNVRSIAFSPDGRTLASVSNNELDTFQYENDALKLWDAATGVEIKTLSGNFGLRPSVAFSPDGKMLVVTGDGNIGLKILNPATGAMIKTFTELTGEVLSVSFSPDSKMIAVIAGTSIKLIDMASGVKVKSLSGHTATILSAVFSPDGGTIASAGEDKTIKIWNVSGGTEIAAFVAHSSDVRSIAFSPDGGLIAGAGFKTIKLWDLVTGADFRTIAAHEDYIWATAFSPDGKTVASGSRDYTIKLWDLISGANVKTLSETDGDYVAALAFTPDGKTIVNASANAQIWDVQTGKEIKNLGGHTDNVQSVAASPDGKIVASVSSDKTVKIWNAATGATVRTLDGHTDTVMSAAFSPDGKILASGSSDGTVKFWNVSNGLEIKTLRTPDGVNSVTFSPDGKTLAAACGNAVIVLWNAETGRELKRITNAPARSLTFSPDGKLLVGASGTPETKIWNAATGEHLASLFAIDEKDWAVTTPDGLFDGSPNAWKLLAWRLDDDTFKTVPLEAFFNEFYRPGLLQDVCAGRTVERPVRDIFAIDIRQPSVAVKLAGGSKDATVGERQVTVEVEIRDAPADKKRRNSSGAKDVRLFRNGSLVKMWSGDVLNGKPSATLTTKISVVGGENVFTAYAFNGENVKSRDAELKIKGSDALKRKGKLQILSVGINRYQDASRNLKFAVPDAVDFAAELRRRQINLNNYETPEVTPLLDAEATRQNIVAVLEKFAAGEAARPPDDLAPSLRNRWSSIEKLQPEDVLVIYYAGHGTASKDRFYLIPHDGFPMKGAGEKYYEELYARSISDEKLESLLETVDAGKILMVIDACNSGQALEAAEKRRGPMNSRGLAQLAYEKGIYILTAAQSFQAALEVSQTADGTTIEHGLLTYSLLEGLRAARADANADKQIVEREWLNFAVTQVPQLQIETMQRRGAQTKGNAAQRSTAVSISSGKSKLSTEERGLQTPRVFYRREDGAKPFVIAAP